MICFSSKHAVAIAGLAMAATASTSNAALTKVSTDAFDVSQGGSILANSQTIGGFDAVAAIGGPNGGGEGGNGSLSDDTIFNNGGVNDLIFSRTSTYTLTAANLFNSSDGGSSSANRATTEFTLYAGTYAAGVFTPTDTLVNDAAVTVNDGSGTQFVFSTPTNATTFEAVFNGVGGERIVELDAVPEPASLGLLAVAAAGMLARRRR